MLPIDFTIGGSLSRLGLSMLVSHFLSIASAMIVIPTMVLTLIVLNSRIVGYLERGRFRRHTDGPTSILRAASLLIDGELLFVGGLVMLYYVLQMPLSIRNYLATAGHQQ